ncbi:DNA repair protein RadA [Candidatus Woesebacteria bacterium]|nr:MAG: DNA repair protein RadA [Candidatus Woesebacteria bacterium]
MKIKKSVYICQTCGFESLGWLGKCTECGSWGSLVETVVSRNSGGKNQNSKITKSNIVNLSNVETKSSTRISTKISELDRVLGGGIVPGQVILIAGEPGIGKSTILMQLSETLGNILYVSGEESAHQIALRGKRLGVKNTNDILILEDTDIDAIIDNVMEIIDAKRNLSAVIIDSIQTMQTSDLSGMAGAAGQVRECTYRLVRLAKSTSVPVIIVGHVTKQGSVAGPALLMHLVDTVLWFEGSRDLSFRLLRARKNRFGATDEVGIFTMEDKGLISVDDTSHLFLTELDKMIAGSAVTSVMEGTRPLLVEIQSLVIPTKMAFPKRVAQGIDAKRLELLLAVLQRRAQVPVNDFDVFVNVVGGIKVKETGADLAICLSVASAYYDKPIPKKLVSIGEVGLLGEVRKVTSEDRRIKETKRLGYKQIVTHTDFGYLKDAVKKIVK